VAILWQCLFARSEIVENQTKYSIGSNPVRSASISLKAAPRAGFAIFTLFFTLSHLDFTVVLTSIHMTGVNLRKKQHMDDGWPALMGHHTRPVCTC